MKLKLFNKTIIIGVVCYDINKFRPKDSYIEITPFHFSIDNIDTNIIIDINITVITLRLAIMIIIR